MDEASDIWQEFMDKKVRLIVKDGNIVRPRDGVFKDIDSTHIFLMINDSITPFLRSEIKRVELKE